MADYDEIEQKLIPYPSFDPNNIESIDIDRVFSAADIEYFGEGLMSRVYKIKNSDWLVKEGRWDFNLKFFNGLDIPSSAVVTESILKLFDYSFLPRKKEVARQYADYLKFAEYMGYFDSEDQFYHPNRSEIFRKQRYIRKTLLGHREPIERIYNF